MLNDKLKLNLKIFDADVKTSAIRDGYGDGLVIAGEENPNVVGLCADLMESTRMDKFAEKFPDRFFQVGVAEQNMVAIAAGLGVSGKIPFIASYATFSPGRNWEQIRTTICYNNANVKIAGHHAGVSTGPDGATHQATEDIAMMRVLPNMKIIVPCDAIEARKATIASAKIWGPVYIRLAREKSPVITTEDTPFVPGRANIIWKPSSLRKKPQVAIIACGALIYEALLAARELEKNGIETIVLNNHTIKPLDGRKIIEVAKKCGAVVTVEEHQIAGGLGGAVAELLAKECPMPIEFVGMRDTFGESGSPAQLLEKYGMGAGDIKEAAGVALRRKSL